MKGGVCTCTCTRTTQMWVININWNRFYTGFNIKLNITLVQDLNSKDQTRAREATCHCRAQRRGSQLDRNICCKKWQIHGPKPVPPSHWGFEFWPNFCTPSSLKAILSLYPMEPRVGDHLILFPPPVLDWIHSLLSRSNFKSVCSGKPCGIMWTTCFLLLGSDYWHHSFHSSE